MPSEFAAPAMRVPRRSTRPLTAQDREFYAFYRSMQAYRESIGSDQDMLVLQPDSEFFKFLQNQVGSTGN